MKRDLRRQAQKDLHLHLVKETACLHVPQRHRNPWIELQDRAAGTDVLQLVRELRSPSIEYRDRAEEPDAPQQVPERPWNPSIEYRAQAAETDVRQLVRGHRWNPSIEYLDHVVATKVCLPRRDGNHGILGRQTSDGLPSLFAPLLTDSENHSLHAAPLCGWVAAQVDAKRRSKARSCASARGKLP